MFDCVIPHIIAVILGLGVICGMMFGACFTGLFLSDITKTPIPSQVDFNKKETEWAFNWMTIWGAVFFVSMVLRLILGSLTTCVS